MQMLRIVTLLAWRNLWRNHRRTLVMISAISIGVWAMIFMTALLRGMVDQMVLDGIDSLPGHVQVHDAGYRDDPGIANLLADRDSELTDRFESAGFVAWAARIKVPAVITSERDSRGVTLYGIDPARERDMTFLADAVVEGRYLEGVDDGGLIIGKALADVLETGLGKRVVIMSQDPDNEIADRGFRVVGIFTGKLEALEKSMVFGGKQAIQAMLKVPDRVNELAVLGDDYRNVEPVLGQVRSLANDADEVLPWTEVDPYLGTMLSTMDGFVLVWMVVVFIALSFGLVNTLVMAVFERVREIGLMLALGMRPMTILAQVIAESILLLSIGLLIGNLLAYATITPLESGIDIGFVGEGMEMFGASSVLYPKLTTNDMWLANGVVLLLGFLASLSPAWRASRYEPIEAITKV